MPDHIHTKVDPDLLNAAANSIESSLQSLDRAFRAIDDALLGALRPAWKGPASDRFYAQYASDVDYFHSQLNALRSINGQLREAAGVFGGADANARDEVNKLMRGWG